MNQRIFPNNQTRKNDAPYKEINPSQGFKQSGNLEDRRTGSTQDSGAKNINPPGRQIASAVKGKYRRSVISLMISLDKVMKVIFEKKMVTIGAASPMRRHS
jgi:hypothetical protein